MESKLKIAGHPIHPMLVSFPIAFYAASVACFITYQCNADVFWFRAALVANCAGVLTAVLAAVAGFVDWLNIPETRKAKKVGKNHMLCNVGALLCFGINIFIQCPKWDETNPDASVAVILSAIGMILTLIAGFLGWSLVQKHHVGVSLTAEQERIDPVSGVN